MDSVEINKKHKEQKKLEKEIKKRQISIMKHKLVLDKQMKLKIQKSQSNITEAYKKKQALFERKKQRELEKLKKNMDRVKKGKKQVKYKKKDKTLARYRKHAFSDFNWCIRYRAKDENGYVKTIDGKVRMWNNCDAGHVFPKSKYPHIAFDIRNCYPQSKRSNRELGTSEGLQFEPEIIKRIGKKEWGKLIELKNNEQLRKQLRPKPRWKDKYIYWHKIRLGHERLLKK